MINQTIRELIATTNYNLYMIIGRKFVLSLSKSISKLECKYFYDILNMTVNYTREEKQGNVLVIELDDLN